METITEYDTQAREFLKTTKTTLKVEFHKYGKHFIHDEQERDIYNITLSRGSREFSFKFGNSINDSGFKIIPKGQKEVKYCKGSVINDFIKDLNTRKTKLLICYSNMRILRVYGYTTRDIKRPVQPSEYSVLSCLTTYDPENLEEFCSNYGYDEDSRKAETIYKAVQDEYDNLKMLFSDEELESLGEIQ